MGFAWRAVINNRQKKSKKTTGERPEKIRGLASIRKFYQHLTQKPLNINRKKKILYFLRSIFISQNHLSKNKTFRNILQDP